jgi:Cobyric acid synthase
MNGILIQSTSSGAGKSFLATAFCRALANKGLRIGPFKSQNMSNNCYVSLDGLEMGRAQAVQAEAARLVPDAFWNLWLNLIRNKKQYARQPLVSTETIKEQSHESLAKAAFEFLDMDYVFKLISTCNRLQKLFPKEDIIPSMNCLQCLINPALLILDLRMATI